MGVPNLSTDNYDIAVICEYLKQKYSDIPEDTLTMGIFGYFSEMHRYILHNTTRMAAQYANESIPTRAKFDRNVIAHALSLGINKIMARPAWCQVILALPEKELIKNMQNDEFVFDKELGIVFGADPAEQYTYHLDYDIIIRRNLLPTGEYVYTAMYDMSTINKYSDITTPYLPAVGVLNYSAGNFVAIEATIREVEHSEISKRIIITNPLDTKTFTFSFETQLAYFYLEIVEDGTVHKLECLYDGLYSTDGSEYCNYVFIDQNHIRIKLNRDSYQPRQDATATIHIYTTNGSKANFPYIDTIEMNMYSNRFQYRDLYCVIRTKTDSQDGADKLTVSQIREAIPKQMLMRNSITTYTDLNNFFNSLDNDSIRMKFLEKIHNQEERLFYAYLLMKNSLGNIIPTNTIDIVVERSLFSNINRYNNILPPGRMFFTDGIEAKGVLEYTDEDIDYYDANGFLFFNPFLIVLNKSPLFVSYFMNVLNYTRSLYFEYVNAASDLQFISWDNATVKREFFTDRDTYKIGIILSQNIVSDFDLIAMDSDGTITKNDIKVIGVIYMDGEPYRYVEGELMEFDGKDFVYQYQFSFKSQDIIDRAGKIMVNGLKQIKVGTEIATYLAPNVEFKVFVLAKLDGVEYDKNQGIEDILPNDELTGYTLTNVYTLAGGMDLYYDYSNIIESYLDVGKNEDGSFIFYIKKVPLIRWTYMNSEERFTELIKVLEKRRLYIMNSLVLLEDSFGIDFKFYNTYGKSILFKIDQNTDETLNRVNLSQVYEVKFNLPDDIKCIPEITAFIKEYLEDINDEKDLHFSVLQAKVLEKFSEQLVYFQIHDVNGYSNDHQNFYKQSDDEFLEAHTVPEFLNINTLNDDNADIKYKIIGNGATSTTNAG